LNNEDKAKIEATLSNEEYIKHSTSNSLNNAVNFSIENVCN